jgi:hypothetical protein
MTDALYPRRIERAKLALGCHCYDAGERVFARISFNLNAGRPQTQSDPEGGIPSGSLEVLGG